MNYILISPVKDEEINIELLISTVLNQTIRPSLWIIVDSNSSDNTFALSQELSKDYDWIHVIKQEKLFEKGYGHINFAQAINEGYNFAKNFCDQDETTFKYIGKVDAAISLEPNYYEVLIGEMEQNPNLAFACGVLHVVLEDNKRMICNPSPHSKTVGVQDMRIYKKEFFEEMNGYPLNYSPDTILLIKAINRKWDIKVTKRTHCEKRRIGGIGGSNISIWNAYKLKGKAMYTLGYDIVFVLLNSIYNSFKVPPHYQFVASVYGYLLCFIKRENKIDDKEVTDYFGKRISKNLKHIFHINAK